MWCHLPTGISRRRLLQFVAVASLFIAFFTTLVFAHVTRAAEGVNQTLAFQGRLAQSSGALVPDGHYNIQFKIYQDGPGTAAGNPGGSLKWTETYINNGGTSGVEVKNGYFSVALGSLNPFGSQVDWNQDTVWLSMNVAGSATDCTAFGGGTCAADGEMLPMKRMTATPFALNSAQLGGKAAENFIQLAQGVQEDASTNSASIAINRTGGSGDFLQLQRAGDNALRINDGGDIVFGNLSDHLITTATSASGTDGTAVQIRAGNGGDGSGTTGGNLILQGGDAGGTNGGGGNVTIDAGSGTGSSLDGYIAIGTTHASNIVIGSTWRDIHQNVLVGTNDTAGSSTNVVIGSGAGASGGGTRLQAKDVIALTTNGVDRAVIDNAGILYLGNGATDAAPSNFRIQGTDSSANGASGGSITIQGGSAATGNTNGGNLVLNGGGGSGTGTNGSVSIGTSNTGDVNIGSSTGGGVNIQSGTNGVSVQSGGVVSISLKATNIQVGDGTASGAATVLTLDKGSSAPALDSSMVGSMYYDTTLGKVQCYEASGWGDCGSPPDSFVSLAPAYANAIITGSGTGTMSTDVCSNDLGVNTSVCNTHETYNFYKWTAPASTSQFKVIYATYQLPANFDKFISGSTSLLGKTDSSDSQVSYYMYRIKGDGSGTVACNSSEFFVSTGAQSTWQKGVGTSTADPVNCGFTAGDRIMFKIPLGSKNNANAYVSNLDFAYSIK